MADVELLVNAALTEGSPLPTIAGLRVYPLLRPEGAPVPAVTYQRVGNTPINSLDGSSGLDYVRIQFDSWAATYAEAKQLAREVRTAMEAAPFKALLVLDLDDYEQATRLYRITQDFNCWQK